MINGIKPSITKKTLLDVKTPFGEAMNKFLNKLTDNAKPHVERFKHMDSIVFKPTVVESLSRLSTLKQKLIQTMKQVLRQ